MRRLDQTLVIAGLAPTRSKAQQMIQSGEVEILVRDEWVTATQASQNVESEKHVRVREGGETLKYVSRGGLKLESALQHLRLNVNGWRCLDIGISTGGFADCLLQHGAKEICGIDVGHGQLHETLRADPRVIQFEGLNVKDINSHRELRSCLKSGVDLCVADLSFISLISVLPVLSFLIPPIPRFLGLVKPQFEVGAANLDKRGVVKDPALFADVRLRVLTALEEAGFRAQEYFPSRLTGQDGNQEFFVYALRA